MEKLSSASRRRRQGSAKAAAELTMLSWLDQHSGSLNFFANLGVLLVWLFYAQIALNGLLKQRRPSILINQIKGWDLDAEAIVANMSEERIYLQLLLVIIKANDKQYTRAITDVYRTEEGDSERIVERTSNQGPLGPGAILPLGSFHDIAQRVSYSENVEVAWQSMELRVISFYGSTTSVMAARRSFSFSDDGGSDERRVEPDALYTAHVHRAWHRARIRHWLREYG